ncbi:MAG: SdrD B-like domain-containing protein, partial [Caldilineaceae bacterium]
MTCIATGAAALGQYANVGVVTGVVPLVQETVNATNPSHYLGFDTPPTLAVSKTPSSTRLEWPGGVVTFTIVITNTSVNDEIDLTTLSDSIYGKLDGQGTCSVPQKLPLGAVYTCAFPVTLTIPADNPGDLAETNIVTARGTGTNGAVVQEGGSTTVVVPCENGRLVSGLIWHDANGNAVLDAGELPFISDPALTPTERHNPPVTLEENDPARPVPDRTKVTLTQDGRFTLSGLRTDTTYTFRVLDDVLQGLGFAPTSSSLRFGVKPLSCAPLEIRIGYQRITGLVGDFLWYDVNHNGSADEWFDANNDGRVTPVTGETTLALTEFMDVNGNGLVDIAGELNACGLNSTGVVAGGTSDGPRVNLVTSESARNRSAIIGNTGYYRFAFDGRDDPLSATGAYTVTRVPGDPKAQESARFYATSGRCKPVSSASNRSIVQVVQTTGLVGVAGDGTELANVQPAADPVLCGETTANLWTTNLTGRPAATDLTLDFGIVCVDAALVSGLGNRVWIDSNRNGIQDGAEPGLAGVVVALYVNGDFSAPIRTVVTGSDGAYLFSGLMPSQYVIEFRLPAGRQFTLREVGNDAAADSDADPATGRTKSIVLAPGIQDDAWDAGVIGVPTGDTPV